MTFDVKVEIEVDHPASVGGWLDITRINERTRVLGLNGAGVQVTWGRTADLEEIPPTQVQFRYRDQDAFLDGENPLSPLYRKVGPGTPLRVSIDGDVRAVVDLASVLPEWDDHPDNVQANVDSFGVKRRLGQGGKPVESALTCYYRRETPWQWWSFESGQGYQVRTVPSSLPAGYALVATPPDSGSSNARESGVVSGGTTVGPLGATNALDVSDGGQLTVNLPILGPSLGLSRLIVEVGYQFAAPVDAVGGSGSILRINLGGATVIQVFALPVGGGGPAVFELSSDSGEFISATSSGGGILDDGAWRYVQVDLQRATSTTLTYRVYLSGNAVSEFAGTTTATALLDPTQVAVSATGELGAVSHLAIWKDGYLPSDPPTGPTPGGSYRAFFAYVGDNYDPESPTDRFVRLTGEQGIPSSVLGYTYDPEDGGHRIGPQGPKLQLDLLEEAQRAGMAALREDRTTAGALVMRTRDSMYNQPVGAGVALTYAGHVGKPFRPALQDDGLANDVTANSAENLPASYVIPDDDLRHWSTQAQPDGAGVRDVAEDFNLFTPARLEDFAAWWAHVRAWREKRFLELSVDLARPQFTADEIAAVRGLNTGDPIYIDTTGAPAYIPYDELRLMVQGGTEHLTRYQHVITFNLTPLDIYEVEIVDPGPTSTIANAIDDNDTSVKLVPGDGPPFITTGEDFHISVGGDPMTVTSISVDTPALLGTGTAAYADNATVNPALPASGITPDVGQLLVCFASCRQTGAGVVGAAPTGWTTIMSNTAGDVKLFGRYYRTGDTAPAVTTTGGAAGNTLGAQVAAWSGLSMTLDKNKPGKYPNGWVESVNGSAANIAYPAYLARRTNTGVLLLGRRDDDWTSVATIAGTSEVGDSSSTAGNDVGLVWDFYNPGAPALVIAQSFTVTGGGAAGSDGLVVGLRPLQTATVTRGIAGLATSHVPGATVISWRPGAVGL